MTSSISWIDRQGLEGTLARIGLAGRRPSAAVRRPAAARVARSEPRIAEDEVPEKVRTPSQEAESAALEPQSAPDFLPPDGPLRRRLEAYLTWLIDVSGPGVAFIVDRDGLPLVNRGADPDLLSIAASVMRLVASISSKLLFPLGRTVTLELEEQQLMLIAAETPIGTYIVGQVGEMPLGRQRRDAATAALRHAFQPSPEQEAVGS